MTLQLTIKQAIPAPNLPKNQLKFHVRSMTGDGDGYDNNSMLYRSDDPVAVDLVYRIVRLLESYAKLDWNTQCNIANSKSWESLYESTFNEPMSDEDHDSLCDLVGWDNIYEQMAAPDCWKITWFDDKSVEHVVDITVDGSAFVGRRS